MATITQAIPNVAKVTLKLSDYYRVIHPKCYDYVCKNCDSHPDGIYTQDCVIAVFTLDYFKDHTDWLPVPAQASDKPAQYDIGTYIWT